MNIINYPHLGNLGNYTGDTYLKRLANKLVDKYNKKINSFKTEEENNIFDSIMRRKINLTLQGIKTIIYY